METLRLAPLLLAASLAACTETPPPAAPGPAGSGSPTAPAAGAARLTLTPIALPGATGSVALDYLAVDRAGGKVWVPAGETASVDVIDARTGQVTRVEGFPTVEREGRSGKRMMGPSSATIGEGFAYVGNRGSSEVCAVDLVKLVKGACVALPSPPDGLQYVAATKEVWATTPRDKSITVIDAATPGKLSVKTKITLDGEPEGYAVDQARGVFYTNLEDGNKTLVLEAQGHKVTATWDPRCGKDGPRGLALDAAKGLLFVACTDHVQVLDAGHGGAPLSSLAAGEGVDNIDYLEDKGQLYVAAGKSGTLTVLRVDPKGALSVLATAPSAPGTRVVVAAADGTAYVADGKQGRILSMSLQP
jgi:DNA-binding beta-propeller fold protein YncE